MHYGMCPRSQLFWESGVRKLLVPRHLSLSWATRGRRGGAQRGCDFGNDRVTIVVAGVVAQRWEAYLVCLPPGFNPEPVHTELS